MYDSHCAILKAWPRLKDLAVDLGIRFETARGFRHRDSIPAAYWVDLVHAAAARGIDGVTYERLAVLAAARRPARVAPHGAACSERVGASS